MEFDDVSDPDIYLRKIPEAVSIANEYNKKCEVCSEPLIQNLKIVKVEREIYKNDAVCTYSGSTYKQDTLGFALSPKYIAKNLISNVQIDLDYISKTAFDTKKEDPSYEYTHWIPVWINEEHGAKATQHIKTSICKLAKRKKYNSQLAAQVLPRILKCLYCKNMN